MTREPDDHPLWYDHAEPAAPVGAVTGLLLACLGVVLTVYESLRAAFGAGLAGWARRTK